MFVELIATIFAGIACAGIAMLLNRLTGRRLPKWIIPIAAGAGMLGMTVSNEYTWYSRTAETLPEGLANERKLAKSKACRSLLLWSLVARQSGADAD